MLRSRPTTEDMTHAAKIIGLILAALSALGFASTFVVGSALTRECGVSPAVLSFLRFAIAGSAMFAVACATRNGRARLVAASKRDALTVAWLGPVGTSVMAWCVFMGCASVSSVNASMADALAPLLIFVFASIRARRIAGGDLACLLCGFAGALLVMQIVGRHGLAIQSLSAGDLYVLGGAATWAVYTVCGTSLILRHGSFVFTVWTMLAGTIAIGAVLPFGDFAWPATPKAWMLVIALSFVSTLLPFWTWNVAQKFLPMSVLGVTAYFIPVVTLGLSHACLGETSTPLQLVGTLLVVVSATIETRRHR